MRAGWIFVIAVGSAALSSACASEPSPVDEDLDGATRNDPGVIGEAGANGYGDLDGGPRGSDDSGVRGDGGALPGTGCTAAAPSKEPAEQLFVAPNGNDSAAGTQAAPLKTLGRAAQRFSNGGTVVVRGGVYGAEAPFDARGTEAKPLVIRAAAGETPIFDGAKVTGNWWAVIPLNSASHVVISGLEIRNCNAASCQGIVAWKSVLDFTVRDTHLHHLSGPGMRVPGRKIRFEHNHIHDVALVNENSAGGGGWPTCFGTSPDDKNPSNPWADDVVIRGNRVHDCWGEGIGLWYASNAIVEDNTVENPWNVGIYADNAFNLRIARNFVHIGRGSDGSGGSGILFGSEPYPGRANSRTHHVVVENNVIVGGTAIGWWAASSAVSTYDNLSFVHNTIVGTKRGALSFWSVSNASAPSGNVLAGNVIAETGGGALPNRSAFDIAGNAWLNVAPPSYAGGKTDVRVDAALKSITTALDARALASVVGAAPASLGTESDFLCAPRDPASPTRGAFEK